MNMITSEFWKWMNSMDDIILKSNQELGLIFEYNTRDRMLYKIMTSYINRIEMTIQKYENDFYFTRYKNLDEYVQYASKTEVLSIFKVIRTKTFIKLFELVDLIETKENIDFYKLDQAVEYHDKMIQIGLDSDDIESAREIVLSFVGDLVKDVKNIAA